MSKKKNAPRFTNVRFRAVTRTHENSTFLGYAHADLVVPAALPGGDDFILSVYNLEVKIVNGRDRFDFTSKQNPTSGKWFDTAHPGSAETRDALTESLFSDRYIAATAQIVREDEERVAESA